MKRLAAIIFGLAAFLALAAMGAVFVMPDDDLTQLIEPLPIIGPHSEAIVHAKHEALESSAHFIDDSIYGLKTQWRNITSFSLTDRRQKVVIQLDPRRKPKPTAPPPPPAVETEDTSKPVMLQPAQEGELPEGPTPAEVIESETEAEKPMTANPEETGPETAPMVVEATEMKMTEPPAPPPPMPNMPPSAPAAMPATEATEAPAPAAMPVEQVEEKQLAAVTPAKPVKSKPLPAQKPPAPPKTDNGAEEHKKGLAFYKGLGGTPKNFKTAAEWFRKSSAKGNAAAQYNLGIMAYLGQGEEQSYAEAANWFLQAAKQDHALAQYNLGFLFFKGEGVEKDDLQAFMWIDRAARLGDEKAIKARDTLEKILPKDIVKEQ